MALSPLVASVLFGVMFFLLGLALWIGAPWYVAPTLPAPLRQKLAKQYWWAGMKARGRTVFALIGREIVPLPSKRATQYGGEEVTVDGERRIYVDPDDRMTTSYRERVALALDNPGVIVDQRIAALGAKTAADAERGDRSWWFEDGQLPTFMERFIRLPERIRGVNLAAAGEIIGGSADGGMVETAEEFTSHSLSGHNDDGIVGENMQVMLVFLGCFLVVFLTMNVLGGGGGGGLGGVVP